MYEVRQNGPMTDAVRSPRPDQQPGTARVLAGRVVTPDPGGLHLSERLARQLDVGQTHELHRGEFRRDFRAAEKQILTVADPALQPAKKVADGAIVNEVRYFI